VIENGQVVDQGNVIILSAKAGENAVIFLDYHTNFLQNKEYFLTLIINNLV
jgi:hypothetical protein